MLKEFGTRLAPHSGLILGFAGESYTDDQHPICIQDVSIYTYCFCVKNSPLSKYLVVAACIIKCMYKSIKKQDSYPSSISRILMFECVSQ